MDKGTLRIINHLVFLFPVLIHTYYCGNIGYFYVFVLSWLIHAIVQREIEQD